MRRLRLVLAQIATGRYLIRNKTIRIVGWLRASAGDRVDRDPPLHWSHRPRGQFAQGMTHPALPNAHWLDMNSGPPSRDILRLVQGGQPALDDELSRRGNGIAGVRQLVRLWDASPYNWTEEQSAAAIVIAPLGVALDLGGASLRAGQLTLRVLSESTEAVRHGSIGVGGYSANEQLYDREIVLRDLDWQPETGLFVTTATLALPGSSRADIFLRHRGATIHQIAVANTPSLPSLMQLAHTSHHPESDAAWRRYLLESRGSDANEFAAAVARLMGGLGLPVVHLPRHKNPNSADSIARLARTSCSSRARRRHSAPRKWQSSSAAQPNCEKPSGEPAGNSLITSLHPFFHPSLAGRRVSYINPTPASYR